MKKEAIILVLLLLVISGCASNTEEKGTDSNKEIAESGKQTSSNLDDFQTAACEAAQENNRCNELPDLGLVTAEECCKELNKCC